MFVCSRDARRGSSSYELGTLRATNLDIARMGLGGSYSGKDLTSSKLYTTWYRQIRLDT